MLLFARNAAIIAAVTLAVSVTESAFADITYLSLGDSIAFGYDSSNPNTSVPSYGDQGFVRPFADALAGLHGGVRPSVVNLGLPGEQSSGFLNPALHDPAGPPRYWQLNLNYPDATTSQNSLMLSNIAAVHAAGGQVGYASLLFGANDVFALTSKPEFINGTPAEQQALLTQTLNLAFANYATVLTELKTAAPEARILLPGYYNPFPAAMPAEHAFYEMVLGAFNPALQSTAAAFGATYVDTYSLFDGNQLTLTNIATGDYHPNQAGYDAIAAAMFRAVPEPSTLTTLALAFATLAAVRKKRGALFSRFARG